MRNCLNQKYEKFVNEFCTQCTFWLERKFLQPVLIVNFEKKIWNSGGNIDFPLILHHSATWSHKIPFKVYREFFKHLQEKLTTLLVVSRFLKIASYVYCCTKILKTILNVNIESICDNQQKARHKWHLPHIFALILNAPVKIQFFYLRLFITSFESLLSLFLFRMYARAHARRR